MTSSQHSGIRNAKTIDTTSKTNLLHTKFHIFVSLQLILISLLFLSTSLTTLHAHSNLQIIKWRFCGSLTFLGHLWYIYFFLFCKIMGSEIDTKSIEPVRTAVSLFGDKGDHKRYQSTRTKSDCEKEVEELTKELANCKVQLEAKHGAQMQALFKHEHNQKMIQELSTLLKKSDIERNKYKNECSEGRTYKDELESKMKEIADLNLESAKVQDQLSHVSSELKATKRELLKKDREIVAARDSELKALTNVENLETDLKIEKEEKEKLIQQVKELNEVIHRTKLAAIIAEEEKIVMLSERDQKIESATKATAQLQQQVEDMKEHIKMLKQDNEALFLSEDSGSNAINNSKIDMELKERKIMDQSVYTEKLEMEITQLKKELMSAKEEMNGLNISNESLTSELKAIKERDIEAQVEIALLKSQLQEHRFAYKNGYNDDIQTEKADQFDNQLEISFMKKELENASAKIAEFRARAEQAISRAELAENGKAALEERIRRHKEHRLRRKAALSALKEESTPNPFSPSTSHGTPGSYQPLGKVLNMKL